MLDIIYCDEVLFDLPPPTLFYRSNDRGIKSLMSVIEKMINEEVEVCLNDLGFVDIQGVDKRIIYKPFSNGQLVKILNSEIITDISPEDWELVLSNLKKLVKSKDSLTYFIEFEGYVEDANFIIEI